MPRRVADVLGRASAPDFVFVSINRYERKKNLPLALRALAALRAELQAAPATAALWPRVHLVMAGGYDARVAENVGHYAELVALAAELDLDAHVTFLRSFSDADKVALLRGAHALLYTPAHEHFGIVPLEAMYCRCPVVAVNSGGPLETVAGQGSSAPTGFLCEQEPAAFAAAMHALVAAPARRASLADNGRRRVEQLFSFAAFATQLDQVVRAARK